MKPASAEMAERGPGPTGRSAPLTEGVRPTDHQYRSRQEASFIPAKAGIQGISE